MNDTAGIGDERLRDRKVAEHSVPQAVIDAFEKRYGGYLSMDRDDNEWRNTWRYKHEHIQSMWEGWRDSWLAARQEIERLAGERDEAVKNRWPHGPLPNPVSGFSGQGVTMVWGDKASMKVVEAAMHSHSQIEWFRTNLRHWREECGKLHAQLRTLSAKETRNAE